MVRQLYFAYIVTIQNWNHVLKQLSAGNITIQNHTCELKSMISL